MPAEAGATVTVLAGLVESVGLRVVTGAATAALTAAAMRRMVGVCIFVVFLCVWVWLVVWVG